MKKEELTARLLAVRRRIRWLLAVDGIARLTAAVIAVLLAAAALDWWVRLPPLLRAAATLLGLWIAAQWIARRIIAPLRASLPLQEIAQRIDERFPETGGRLTTTAEHLESPAEHDGILWQRTLRQSLSVAQRLPWSKIHCTRRPVRSITGALIAIATLGTAMIELPALLSTGIPRFIIPFSPVEWAHRVQIEPLTGDRVIAVGEPLTVNMRVVRGWSPRLRAWVVWKEEGQPLRHELMSAGEPGAYSQSWRRVHRSATYWFLAGDDSTRDRPGRVRVVEAPVLEEAAMTLVPPTYAASLGTARRPLESGQISVLEGSRAVVELRSSKPIGQDPDGADRARLVADDGTTQPFEPVGDDRRAWRGSFEVTATRAWTLALTDVEGVSLQAPPRIEITVLPDAPPRIAITRPAHALEVTPEAEVPLEATAEDDVDVTRVTLRARRTDAASATVTDLGEVELWHGSARPAAREPTTAPAAGAPRPVRKEVVAAWPLSDYGLQPGDTVEYWAEAHDAFERDGARHEPARSAVHRLRVISQIEFGERVRDQMASLTRQLQQLASDQEALRRRTETAADPSAARDVRELVLRQQHTAAGTTSAAERFDGLIELLRQNRFADASAAQGATAAAESLRRTAAGPMSRAADQLRRVPSTAQPRGQDDAQERSTLLADAVRAQDEALNELRAVLSRLEQWSDVDGVVRRTRDLLDRQEHLTRATTRVTADLAGRDAAALSRSDRERLEDAAAKQDALRRELDEMLARLDRLMDSLTRRDPAGADALARSRDAAEREGANERMRAAADEIRRNRGLKAEEEQQAAEQALRSMLAAVNQKSDRRLAELSRELADLSQQLQRLIRTQEKLSARTESTMKQADAAIALPDLSPQQTTLRRTAAKLTEKMETTLRDAPPAVTPMKQAQAMMADAAGRLDNADGPPAVTAQIAAVERLNEAADALDEALTQTERELVEQSLAAVRDELAGVRDDQIKLTGEAEPIATRQRDERRLGRADGIHLSRQSEQQTELKDRLDAVRGKLEGAVVYDYVCGRAAEDMQSAADNLRQRDAVAAVSAQRRVVEQLNGLIDALAELPEAAKTRFVEDRVAAAGGDPGAAKRRTVPPVAELKVLRQLQSELNEAVRAFDARVPPPPARTEAELNEAESLGQRQRALHEMASKLADHSEGR